MLPHAKKGRLKKYTDIARFPWDVQPKILEKSEVNNLFESIRKRDELAKNGKAEIIEVKELLHKSK